MQDPTNKTKSRRSFLEDTSKITAAGAIAGATSLLSPQVSQANLFTSSDETMNIALVGCGGRGTGAADNAMSTTNGPVKLVAMADVFPDRLKNSFRNLTRKHADKVDVPEDRQFLGFDAYKKAIDCLKPGDVVIFTTPPAFRWLHFTYAIDKGINVFMEKPVTVDGPTTKRMLALNEQAKAKNLKVGVGLMCRHSIARQELLEKINAGEIGDIMEMRAYRMAGPTGSAATKRKPKDMSEVEFQLRNFHAFIWASGGAFSDFNIHGIDECCMIKGAWPVSADASGGRHYKEDYVDQNFDSYTVEYTYPDGTRMYFRGRNITGCKKKFACYAQGTKGSAIVSISGHMPARSRIFKGFNMTEENMTWHYDKKEPSPYVAEWEVLTAAIRNNTPHNEVDRGAMASLVTSMGRMAAHTGQLITIDQMMNSPHEFAPDIANMTMDGPAPVMPDKDGEYPIPFPGLKKKREY